MLQLVTVITFRATTHALEAGAQPGDPCPPGNARPQRLLEEHRAEDQQASVGAAAETVAAGDRAGAFG